MTNYHRLTVIIGPSGAGKSTLTQKLISHTGAELVRTYTDRPRRGTNDDDTHIFVDTDEMKRMERADMFLGKGAMLGYHYGLPHFSNEDSPKVVLLRAPFVPEVKLHQPDAAIIQIEAPVDLLLKRLAARGDEARADATLLQQEMMYGHTMAPYIVSTDKSLEESYIELYSIWNKIHEV